MVKDNTKLQLAYDKIKDMVISSKEYSSFINSIINNPYFISKVKNIPSEELSANLPDSFKDLDFVYELSNKLGMQDDFSKMIVSSCKDYDVVKRIIVVKLLEYYYGNTTKEDLDEYDELLHILQVIFGSDVLIESVTNNEALYHQFCTVMGTYSIDDYDGFINVFNDIFDLVSHEKNHDRIVEIIKDNIKLISDYTNNGLLYKREMLGQNEYEDLILTLPDYLIDNNQKNM